MYSQKAPNYGPYLPELRSIRITYWFRHFLELNLGNLSGYAEKPARAFLYQVAHNDIYFISTPPYLSTPPVRGHAEACPSTTYTKICSSALA